MRATVLFAVLTGCGGAALPHGTTVEACGSCHPTQHAEWHTSHHARSTASPVFQALLPRVEAAWGASARARCEACHAPGFGGDDGIGCVTCHGAVGNRGTSNGALVVSLAAPLAGTKQLSSPAHEVEPRGLLSSATLCGTCHEVHGPGLLEEPTLTEFSASRFASTDECVTCHTNSLSPWGEGRGEGRHALVGVDPPWGAAPEDQATAASATSALWARALSLEVWRAGDGFDVTLTNSGGGHDVPTGAAHLRDVWVDVEFSDATGRQVLVSRVLELGARLTASGRDVALVTDAMRVEPRGLGPGRSRTVRIGTPAGLTAPVRVVARVSARAVRLDALVELGLGSFAADVPTIAVAERSAR